MSTELRAELSNELLEEIRESVMETEMDRIRGEVEEKRLNLVDDLNEIFGNLVEEEMVGYFNEELDARYAAAMEEAA
jgi:hypothetical protein